MRSIYFLISLSLFSLYYQATLSAQFNGTPDNAFANQGIFTLDLGFNDNLEAVVVRPNNGYILAAGTALTESFSGQLLVVQLTPDGTPDVNFGNNGVVRITDFQESYAYDIILLPDGSALIVGLMYNQSFQASMLVLKLLANGSIDTTFGVNGFFISDFAAGDELCYSADMQVDGKIVLAGHMVDNNFNNAPLIARLNANGTVDTNFGMNGSVMLPVIANDNSWSDVEVMFNGKIVAAGYYMQGFTQEGQTDKDLLIARYNSNGTLDDTFGDDDHIITTSVGPYADVAFCLDVTQSGSMYVGGYTTALDFGFDALVCAYNSDGSTNTVFGDNGTWVLNVGALDVVADLQAAYSGQLVMAGSSGGFFADNRDFFLVRRTFNGGIPADVSNDGVFTTEILGGFDDGNALDVQSNGQVIIAGKANNGTQNDIAIVRYEEDTQLSVTNPVISNFTAYPNPVAVGQNLHLPASPQTAFYSLVDMQGREMYRTSKGQIYIPVLPSFTAGVYLCVAHSTDGSKKFSKINIVK